MVTGKPWQASSRRISWNFLPSLSHLGEASGVDSNEVGPAALGDEGGDIAEEKGHLEAALSGFNPAADADFLISPIDSGGTFDGGGEPLRLTREDEGERLLYDEEGTMRSPPRRVKKVIGVSFW